VPNTAFSPRTVAVKANFVAQAQPRPTVQGLEVVFRPDPTVHDGRFANNAWLQELPKSLTKLTWDNAALVSPSTAERLRLISGDVVELKQGGRTLRIAVWLAPGQAQDTLTLNLGYGRTRAGRTGNNTGFNVNALRTSDALDILQGVELTKTGENYDLACTQDHWTLEGRNLVRVATKAQYDSDPKFAQKMDHTEGQGLTMFWQQYKYDGYAWGMTIDQNVCTGCNSCVVACVAENNVPVVGKAQVMNGREMHWLRVDRYYTGDIDSPDTYHQPMPCQQCENASCEVVCPVAATTHSDEGLNDMVYNRCRRHALLLEQLSVQSAALQLSALSGLGHAELVADAQSRRHGAQPRRHGEMHLLRAAHQPGAHRCQARRSEDSRRRDPDRLSGGLPDQRDRVRRHQ
jgi:molybdopterin-containing oxidoreductase family iron-sulfur binding subunit